MRLSSLILLFATCAVSCAGRTHRTTAPPSAAPSASAAPADSAAPVESNPPGDIPDTQAFVEYRSAAGGYHLEVPEGWARTEHASSVVFADKLHSVGVDIETASGPRTIDTVRSA